MRVEQINWIGENQTGVGVKVRSLAPAVEASIEGDQVRFANSEFGVAPGQAAVFYDGSRLLGGGWIAETSSATQSAMDAAAA
jgi:tRNA-specific 2-thiouridylase